jgi:hypothetical protein
MAYFRERLGESHPQGPAGEMGPTGAGEASDPRGPRWWVLVLLALVIGIIVGVALARAGEQTRVDLFDTHGRRTGYAVVDQGTGRVDFYDTMSRHTGYGRVDGVAKVERFGRDGKRQGETAVPVLPKAARPR